MTRLIQEAALDDRFNTQMNRLEGAINNLRVIIEQMHQPGASSPPTATQKLSLRHALADLKKVSDAA
jgi:hypothetical protein